jgi:hypothetical protein
VSVLPMTTRLPRNGEETPRSLNLPRHDGARRNLRSILGLDESQHESPGADVLRRHPTLPEDVYRQIVRNAVEREESAETLHQNGSPTFTN